MLPTTSSLCAPFRSAIVTRKYQEQWGSYTIPDVEQAGIPEEIKSLPKEFQQNGYHTALICKWHVSPKDRSLKNNKNISAAHFRSSSEKARGPLDMGFDYYYGYNDSHSTYYKASNLWENTSAVPPLEEKEFLTDILSDKAISFVKQTLSNNKPFFLYYAPMTLHGG